MLAIPGRIVRVRGQAHSFMKPELGASTHLACILLEVEHRQPRLRGAMNLRYHEKMRKVLSKLQVKLLTIGHAYPSDSQDRVLGALRNNLADQKRGGGAAVFEALVDLGGRRAGTKSLSFRRRCD